MEAPIRRYEPLSLRNIEQSQVSGCTLPTLLYGDQNRLQQVVANLLKNALRFSRAMPVYIFAAYDRQKQMLAV